MEANGTTKKPAAKKMRLSLGLARVSPTGTQPTLNEQNVEEEVNGDAESAKKSSETTEPVQIKLEETVENESEITTEINDKLPKTRARKRKAEVVKEDQIIEESKENTDVDKETEESKTLEDNVDSVIIKDEPENSDTKLDTPSSPKIPRTSARRRSKPPISFKKTKVKTKTSTEDKKVSDSITNMSVDSDSGKTQDENLEQGTDEINPVIKEELNDSVTSDTKENMTEVTSSMDADKDTSKDEKLMHDSVSKLQTEDLSFDVSSSAHNSATSTPRTSQKSVRANRNNSPAAVLMKKTKVVPDLTNRAYLKPFQYGWKRELVYRATSDSNMKRHGDVYYYTPTGKKVRSMREVAENLRHKELSLDDFTFCKEPLGLDDPEKEVIRDARMKGTGTPIGNSGSAKKKTKPKKTKTSSDVNSDTTVASNTKIAKTPKATSPQIKVKVPGRLGHGGRINSPKSERKRNTDSADMEIGLLPPSWDTHQKKTSKQTKPQVPVEKPVKSKRNSQKPTASVVPSVQPDHSEKLKFAQYFFTNLSVGYDALLQVFQYLKVQELLRAGMVCRMWRDLASKPSLWSTVRMKNSQVCDWDGLVASLNRYGTRTLDLRKMLIPGNGDEMWTQFSSAISKATSLTKIYLCRCPATVVEELARTNPNLELINAVTIKCDIINPAPFENLKDLQELRLKSQNGISFKEDMTALKNLINLKHLSLVSIKVLGLQGVEVISALENLETLELGECTDFADNFGTTVLSGLKKLEKLRLEKGPTSSTCTYDILATISKLPKMEQLELVNFDVKAGFDKAIAACTNIKRFLIIPTYISQSATTNHMVLNGVVQLNNTLSHFVWGVTLELLRVTELFVDQCDKNPKKEGSPKKDKKCLNAESIPVLKPVPFMMSGREDTILSEDSSAKDNPQVEILPLANLQKLLCEKLPKTRVKILKIPFHATWRQSIHDSIQ